MEQGMLYDIAHGSFVDGPGVRTTVFFKGCNLKCSWCHNPESQSYAPQIIFYQNKCIGCMECQNVCPNHLKNCTLCGECTKYCPVSARKICGKVWTLDEVMKNILQDKMFFQISGGGVTFSGGECMLQIDFLESLLKRCRQEGIHTAVDTAGHVPWEYFEKILPYADMFLYDVKCYSPQLHKEGTGVSNERILNNLQKLSKCFHGDIIIRIPVIPGYNMDTEEMKKIADFLKSIRHSKVELLGYHKLGENKYAAIAKELKQYAVPDAAEIKQLEELFQTVLPDQKSL